MKSRRLFIIFALALLSLPPSGYAATKKVCIKGVCVRAEVADSKSKRAQGLMFMKSLDEKSGMLFVFNKEAKYGFWMKNMLFPLDIIWINAKKMIVDIDAGVSPCKGDCDTIAPKAPVRYVLEVNSGFTKKNNIKVGDRVKF